MSCRNWRNCLLTARSALLGGRLPVALLERGNNHGGDKLLFTVIVKLDHDPLFINRHYGSQAKNRVFYLSTLVIRISSHKATFGSF